MIKSIVFHVGGVRAMLQVQRHCTALSSIPSSPICYPHSFGALSLPGIREHSLLLYSACNFAGMPAMDTLLRQLQEQTKAAEDAGVLCLSSAGFMLFPDALIMLKSAMKLLFPQARHEVLLTLAPQEEEFRAHFSINSLCGGCYLWQGWLQEKYSLSPGYDVIIHRLRTLFGASATHVLVDDDGFTFYEALQKKVMSLFEMEDVPFSMTELQPSTLLLPSHVALFLRTVSSGCQLPDKTSQRPDYFSQLDNLQNISADSRDIFSSKLRSEIQKRYAESNAKAAQLLGRETLFGTFPTDEIAESTGLNDTNALHVAQNMDAGFRHTLLEIFDQIPMQYKTYDMRICHNALKRAVGIPYIVTSESEAKVSVVTLTYNHAKYIEQNIQSVIEQKTDFQIQHIIADDASNDGTQEIILDYARRYSHIVPVFQQKRPNYSGNNVQALFSLTRTQYVALCDGDDYFTDPYKLQKQVDFLDARPDYALCFHPVYVVYEDGTNRERFYPPLDELPRGVREFYYLADLLKRNFIQTNSVMYRWRFKDGLPDWFRSDLVPGDWYWHLLHAENGKIGFINEVMSVYRRHRASLYYTSEIYGGLVDHRLIHGMKELEMYDVVNKHFDGRYLRAFSCLANGVFSAFLKHQLETDDESYLKEATERFPILGVEFLKEL